MADFSTTKKAFKRNTKRSPKRLERRDTDGPNPLLGLDYGVAVNAGLDSEAGLGPPATVPKCLYAAANRAIVHAPFCTPKCALVARGLFGAHYVEHPDAANCSNRVCVLRGELAEIVAYNVRELRKAAGLTQIELAARIKKHRNTVVKIEKPNTNDEADAQNITLETLEDLAIGLGVTVSRLVRPPPPPSGSEIAKSLEEFLKSPDATDASDEEKAALASLPLDFGVPSHKAWLFLLEGVRDTLKRQPKPAK